jgi:mono/diheme cytochrome c family protein
MLRPALTAAPLGSLQKAIPEPRCIAWQGLRNCAAQQAAQRTLQGFVVTFQFSPKAAPGLAGAILATLSLIGPSSAQETTKDPYQRSLEIYQFTKAAASGPERGQEIFYYKCWFCHNEFTKDIPKLTGLYQHANMLSGEPVNDATVKEKIRDGGPAMPAYKYALSDADLADLVSYLREKCCWDSDSPPLNPHFRAR